MSLVDPSLTMDETSFISYVKRFRNKLGKDASPWARDNLWALVMYFAPIILSAVIDWRSLRPVFEAYGIVLLMYAVVHVVRTPWRLDKERVSEIQNYKEELAKTQTELANLRSLGPEAEMSIEEVHFLDVSPANTGRESLFHIFVRAQIVVKSPPLVDVAEYQLDLTADGESLSATAAGGLEDFRLVKRRSTGPPHRLGALDMRLPRGRPVAGWIHFITTRETTKYDLQLSDPVLVLVTPHGAQSSRSKTARWNDDPDRYISKVD